MALTPGMRLGAYEIVAVAGVGGMGEVYRAVHSKLRREVAIKVLPPDLALDPGRISRFEREARSASALNHPNIVTIHDIGEHDGTTFIAMELVAGRTLGDILADGPLPIGRALRIGSQVADGLAKAHAAGIVHRDIKPANVMVTDSGLVKILDFGLAKPLSAEGDSEVTAALTRTGDAGLVGTPHYMSPEQWSGDRVDHRSDQFVFGALLYEMLSGRRPFDGTTLSAVMSAVLTQSPTPLRQLRGDVPATLERIVAQCLEKDPARRFPSTDRIAEALRACEDRRVRARSGLLGALRRPVVAVPLAIAVLATLGSAAVWVHGSERRWAEREAVSEITAMIDAGDVMGAFRTGLTAGALVPHDPARERALARITLPGVVNTVPQGAEIRVKDYTTPDAPWIRLGTTPLSMQFPYAIMRWRITSEGHEPIDAAPYSTTALAAFRAGFVLDTVGGLPPGMVRIPAGPLASITGVLKGVHGPIAMLGTYYMDRYEVTNREYLAFVEAGGYREPSWWPSPIEREGRELAWREAMDALRDRTGRPGPADWELGRHPEGEEDYPVGGLSWFEAAAYCAWAGKSLPTIFHWFHAIGQNQTSDILGQSNVGGTAKAPVGQYEGLAAYGTYDMAGNVREWAWNATGALRYNLSSGWNEPGYVFRHASPMDPWSRGPTHGVRCVRYVDEPLAEQLGPFMPQREYRRPEPMDDQAFELVRGMYAYERSGLDARVERVNDSLPHWRRETVSFSTAYGDERMEVHLLIPRDVEPPYQSVIWLPGGDVYALRSSETLSSAYLVDFIPRTGRVLVQPVFHGMYERHSLPPWGSPTGIRDMVVRWAQDIGRTIDYLETRPDFDPDRIAFYGFSNGALFAPIFGAVEPRLGAMILLGGGLVPELFRPEAHPVTFAPRARTPALMINGRDDFLMPYEIAQRPLFELLGAPEDSKRHAVLPGGHLSDRRAIIREVLEFLDRQFGPVAERQP